VTVEQTQATEWNCINKLNITNYFCMVPMIGQIKPWRIFKNKNSLLHWMNGASTINIARRIQSGQCRSILQDNLWYLQWKCEQSVKRSLAHRHKWVQCSWRLKTASQQLNEHSGTSQQWLVSRKPQIFFFWVCGYNKLNKFNEGNIVFADVKASLWELTEPMSKVWKQMSQ